MGEGLVVYAQTFDFISLEFCVTSVSSAYAVYRESLRCKE